MSTNETQPQKSNSSDPPPVSQLRAFVKDRRLTKETLDSDEFDEVVGAIAAILSDTSAPQVWSALSVLGRAAAVSKPAEQRLAPLIVARLQQSLPDFVSLPDGEDRYYLARSIERSEAAKFCSLAITQLAEEDTGETARKTWASIAVHGGNTLSEILEQLNASIERAIKEAGLSVDAVCRRIRRINAVMADLIATADIEPGDYLGRQLRAFYVGHFPSSGPSDRRLREEASNEFLVSFAQIIRLNFAARTDPDAYSVVPGMRRWWHPGSPNQEFERLARSVGRLGAQSLFIFARQGVMNKPLRGALIEAAGDKAIRAYAQDFVDSTPSLDPKAAYWLVNGKEPRATRSAQGVDAISEAKLDEYLGRLLIALDVSPIATSAVERALEDIKDLMPVEGGAIAGTVSRLATARQWANALGQARRIELAPKNSDLVEFDPSSHSGAEDLRVGARAKVIVPGVKKTTPNGTKIIVIKSEVEPDDG